MKKIGFFLIITFVGCSPNPQIDYERASKEVENLTINITRMMTDGREAEAYNSLMHKAVKEKFPIESFREVGGKLSKKLGKFKSLQINRLDLNVTSQGLIARGIYVGTFEKGKGDVTVVALHTNNKWFITRFNVNSPLLYNDPKKYRRRVEVYVVDSDFLLPGQKAKLVGKEKGGDEKTIAENVQILSVRWKISMSDRRKGFVTLALSQDEQMLIKKHSDIALRKK